MSLMQISDFISNHLMGSAVAIGAIIEMALRLYPSEKPRNILYAISDVIHAIASISKALAEFSDKVLPQRLK